MRRAERRGRVVSVLTKSERETEELGVWLAAMLPIHSVVLLSGSLGAGKTTFARGLALGLGVGDPSVVSSPSFTLVNVYHGRCTIYHVDLYRLSGNRELYTTGLDEILDDDGVTIIEWSDRIGYPIPSGIEVAINNAGDDHREITLRFPRAPRTKLQDRKKTAGYTLVRSKH